MSTGFEGIQEQDVCNKIMARLIENYSTIFEPDRGQELTKTKPSSIIIVKVGAVTHEWSSRFNQVLHYYE